MAKMQKVEILMSLRLRKSINKYRKLSGESISGYIRQALYQRVFSNRQQK